MQAIATYDFKDGDFRCRLLNHGPIVTLMFDEDEAGECALTDLSHNASLRTKRGMPVNWQLCNSCDAALNVTLSMKGWEPLAGPWLQDCVADSADIGREVLARRVAAKKSAHIICSIQDRDVEAGPTATEYSVTVQEDGKKPRIFNTPTIDVGDH